jgi:hypothetical protein
VRFVHSLHERYGTASAVNLSTTRAQTYTISGPLLRIAPDEVSIADPQATKSIYKVGGKFYKTVW